MNRYYKTMTNLYDIIPGVRYLQLKLNQIWSYIPPPPKSPNSTTNDTDNNKTTKYKILVVHAHPNPESSYNASIVQAFVQSATTSAGSNNNSTSPNVLGGGGNGHEVRQIALYDHPTDPIQCYRPNLSRWERDHYFDLLLLQQPQQEQQQQQQQQEQEPSPLDPTASSKESSLSSSSSTVVVQEHIELLQWCDTLVLIYPTWWMNTPASLKGFFDRTLLPGPTWEFPTTTTSTTTTTTSTTTDGSSGSRPFAAVVGSLGLVPKLQNIQRIVGISTYGANNMTVFLAGDNGRRMIANAIRHSVCPQASIVWLGLYGVDTATLQQRQDFLTAVANLPSSKNF